MFDSGLGNRDGKALSPVVAAVILTVVLIPVHLFNRDLFCWLNSLHSPMTDSFWLTFTTLGDGLILGIIMGAFVVKNPRVTALGLMLIVISGVVVQVLKAAFPTPRPAEAVVAVHVVGPLLRSGSFPSGHTASAISAALGVWYGLGSRVAGLVASIAAVLIALSRIFVGAHFPQDVVGGAICALACFVLVNAVLWPVVERHIPHRPMPGRTSFRVALGLELAMATLTVAIWGPHGAESPTVAIAVGIFVLVLVITRYCKLRAVHSAC